jgi:methyltransferase (TIGR00027 family)
MGNETPSFTALAAAAARAAHLIVDDNPRIFDDTLAEPLLGNRAGELMDYHRLHGTHLVLAGARAQAVCRSRYTEDRLAGFAGNQYVVLGAGLDTFAYRSDLARRIRVFEVDQPGTQEWKRAALATAGIAVPDNVTFVAADFARDADRLVALLRAAGLDAQAPALVSWLGVTMYLTRDAVGQVLADYMLPGALRDSDGTAYADLVAEASAARGEPWLSFFAPDDLSALARRHGVGTVGHVYQRDTVPAGLWHRSDALRPADLAVLFHGRAGDA